MRSSRLQTCGPPESFTQCPVVLKSRPVECPSRTVQCDRGRQHTIFLYALGPFVEAKTTPKTLGDLNVWSDDKTKIYRTILSLQRCSIQWNPFCPWGGWDECTRHAVFPDHELFFSTRKKFGWRNSAISPGKYMPRAPVLVRSVCTLNPTQL